MGLKAHLLQLCLHTLSRALKWVARYKKQPSRDVKSIQKKFSQAWMNPQLKKDLLIQFLVQNHHVPEPALVELLKHKTTLRTVLAEHMLDSSSSCKDADSLVYLVPLLVAHVHELQSEQLFCTCKSWWVQNFRPYTLLALLVTSVHALFYIPGKGGELQLPPHLVFDKAMCLIAAFVHSAVRAPVLSYSPLDTLLQDPEVAEVVQIELRCSRIALEEEVIPFLQQWMLGFPASSSNPDHQRAWFYFWQLQKEQFSSLIDWGVQNAKELFILKPEDRLKRTTLWLQSLYEESSCHSQPASVAKMMGHLKLGVHFLLENRAALQLTTLKFAALQTFLRPPPSYSKYLMLRPGGKMPVDLRYGKNLVEFGPPLVTRGETFQLQWDLSNNLITVNTGPYASYQKNTKRKDAMLLQLDLPPQLAATDDPWRKLLDGEESVFVNVVKEQGTIYPKEIDIRQGRTHLQITQGSQYGRYQLIHKNPIYGEDTKAQNSVYHALGQPIFAWEGCGKWCLSHNGIVWSLYYEEKKVLSFRPEFSMVRLERSEHGAVLLRKRNVSLQVLDCCRQVLCSVDLPLETTSLKRLLNQKQFKSQKWLSVVKFVPLEGFAPTSKAEVLTTALRKPLPRAAKRAPNSHRGSARHASHPYSGL